VLQDCVATNVDFGFRDGGGLKAKDCTQSPEKTFAAMSFSTLSSKSGLPIFVQSPSTRDIAIVIALRGRCRKTQKGSNNINHLQVD
jgi:hypothetical protein